ncbi:MAG TPA: response regulator [Pyrinomonadaceae bacterium]|nr:response regulator [Pyrinomonadaceae bacterium]
MSKQADRPLEQAAPLVMIVDDSDDIREMIKFVLDGRGYRVVEAGNGQEALKLARVVCPALILMDLSMPVLDGFGAARGIREITEMCKVPIVAISAHNTIDHRAKALAVGFDDYLTKPLNFAQMLNLIQRFLQPA